MSAKNFKPFFLNSNLSFGRAGGDTVENLLRPPPEIRATPT